MVGLIVENDFQRDVTDAAQVRDGRPERTAESGRNDNNGTMQDAGRVRELDYGGERAVVDGFGRHVVKH
jgi:hypothetical protein